MTGRLPGRPALAAAGALIILAVAPSGVRGEPPEAEPPASTPAAATEAPAPKSSAKPRAFLIYLIDGSDPIIVKRYVEEGDQLRFEKYGGWIGIPRYEVLRIVPDEPDRTVALPPPPAPAVDPDADRPAATAAADALYVTTKSGAAVKASAVTAEGAQVRVTVPDGSFTLPRSDLVGVVRVPATSESAEAWLSLFGTGPSGAPAAAWSPSATAGPAKGPETEKTPETAKTPEADPGKGANGAPPEDRFPISSSDGPALLRLTSGQVMRVDGFWIEGNEVRVRRLGGMIGLALSEVARLIPDELAPVRGRTAVRFARQLGPDLLEVRVKSGLQRVRLIGIEPVGTTRTADDPWKTLSLGLVVYLEFDRQRYDPAGDWLAYVVMPNGRMLNAELIRLGLARPRADGRNLRYLDLFQEIAGQARAN